MRLIKSQILRYVFEDSIIFVLIITSILFLSCQNDEQEEICQSPYTEEDVRNEEALRAYLQASYVCSVDQVSVTKKTIQIAGKFIGEGVFYLSEISPYV